MAFNKLILILALVSCAFAMPVQDSRLSESSTNSGIDQLEESTLQTSVTSSFDEETTTVKKDEESTTMESSSDKSLDIEGDNDKDSLIKRSIEEDESNDDDLETAAGTNALRPLFVYRQQVAYRQRIRNANRRGYRRF